jgi:hypothetical protein
MKTFVALLSGLLIGISASTAAAPQITQKIILWERDEAKANAKLLLTEKSYQCLNKLLSKESAWNPSAKNPKSSAKGIGQLLDGTYKSIGMKHVYKADAQLIAVLAYISRHYGSGGTCAAWRHFQKHNWY